MEHHVFAVWDFMSMLKYLQALTVPSSIPWRPPADPAAARMINEIVLAEESDEIPPELGAGRHLSHFELYLLAMDEIGADSGVVLNFIDLVRDHGVRVALNWAPIPEPSRRFMRLTFNLVTRNEPYLMAAAFAAGRENLIPGLFRRLLERLKVTPEAAPAFHHYLHRHIEVDGDSHGPAAELLARRLCGEDAARLQEADQVAAEAVTRRFRFNREIGAAIARATAANGGVVAEPPDLELEWSSAVALPIQGAFHPFGKG